MRIAGLRVRPGTVSSSVPTGQTHPHQARPKSAVRAIVTNAAAQNEIQPREAMMAESPRSGSSREKTLSGSQCQPRPTLLAVSAMKATRLMS